MKKRGISLQSKERESVNFCSVYYMIQEFLKYAYEQGVLSGQGYDVESTGQKIGGKVMLWLTYENIEKMKDPKDWVSFVFQDLWQAIFCESATRISLKAQTSPSSLAFVASFAKITLLDSISMTDKKQQADYTLICQGLLTGFIAGAFAVGSFSSKVSIDRTSTSETIINVDISTAQN